MPSQYEVNETLLGISLIPPHKRKINFSSLVVDLLTSAQWLNNKDTTYLLGDQYLPLYDTSITYNFGELVVGWFNYSRGIFLSLQNSNLNQPLNNISYWLPIIDNFIGGTERSLYNSTKMVLEWGLNKYFGTNFSQPPGVSDIYISDLNTSIEPFYISDSVAPVVGGIGNIGSIGYVGVPSTPFTTVLFGINYIVYVPSAVYSALPGFLSYPTDSTAGNIDHYFTNFISNYNVDGVSYKILCY